MFETKHGIITISPLVCLERANGVAEEGGRSVNSKLR